jgi:hypothetical protein
MGNINILEFVDAPKSESSFKTILVIASGWIIFQILKRTNFQNFKVSNFQKVLKLKNCNASFKDYISNFSFQTFKVCQFFILLQTRAGEM